MDDATYRQGPLVTNEVLVGRLERLKALAEAVKLEGETEVLERILSELKAQPIFESVVPEQLAQLRSRLAGSRQPRD